MVKYNIGVKRILEDRKARFQKGCVAVQNKSKNRKQSFVNKLFTDNSLQSVPEPML